MPRRTRRMRTGRRSGARPQVVAAPGPDLEALLKEPVFRVLTVDRLNWINPYTGELIPAPFDYRDAAREVLQRERPWETGQSPMSLHRVQIVRWTHYLRSTIRDEARLRMFDPEGAWLNPYTGRWVDEVRRVDGKINATTLGDMAAVLAGCEAAAEGGEMLPSEQLTRIQRESVRAASETSQRLRETGTGSGPFSLTPTGAQAVLPPAGGGTKPFGPSETGSFGWNDLFGDDSPFDRASPKQQAATDEIMQAHKMLTEAGIDWAMHPGFDGGRSGRLTVLQPTADEQVLILMGSIDNPGDQGVELCTRVRNELRYIGERHHGFTATTEAVVEFFYEELGPDHALSGFLGLIDPAEHDLDCITIDSLPAIAVERGDDPKAQALGGNSPALGTMYWDDYRKHINPTIIQLKTKGTTFAMHQEAYHATNAAGLPLGPQAVWRLVSQLANERPKEVLSRVMAQLHKHTGRRLREHMPGLGMWAMRVRT